MDETQAWIDFQQRHLKTFDGSTLGPAVKDSEFLRNRLLCAFTAGVEAGRQIELACIARKIIELFKHP